LSADQKQTGGPMAARLILDMQATLVHPRAGQVAVESLRLRGHRLDGQQRNY
jgi:hypothetical protein